MPDAPIRALLFDVFGTVVDWRSGVEREGRALAARRGIDGVDWAEVADRWRALYQPSMQEVRSGARPFVALDVLHRESIERVVAELGIEGLDATDLDDLTLAWHRLDPWPDAVEGLARLKARYVLATQSNGNIALMVNMAKRAGLPWDCILGAEVTRHYKPDPACYRLACEALALPGDQCLMVAAHPGDLEAARDACGMRTAYIPRPLEYGDPARHRPPPGTARFDYTATDLVELAQQLGA